MYPEISSQSSTVHLYTLCWWQVSKATRPARSSLRPLRDRRLVGGCSFADLPQLLPPELLPDTTLQPPEGRESCHHTTPPTAIQRCFSFPHDLNHRELWLGAVRGISEDGALTAPGEARPAPEEGRGSPRAPRSL